MKKIILLFSTLALMLSPVVANATQGVAVGVTVSDNSLDSAGKEDVDSNGSIDATKNVSDDITIGSIFVEFTNMGDRFGITLGVDHIPFDADIDKRSITQSALGDSTTSASTGTNSVEASVSDHTTFYIQPGYMIGDNTMLYGTFGFASATINGKSTSITHTNINKDQDLDGTKIGVGVKKVFDSGLFIKADYAETEYDTITFTTSNSTKATADLDNTAFALSLGKQF